MSGYQAIVVGVSAGGTSALMQLLPVFPETYLLPIIIVQHLHPQQTNRLIEYYNRHSAMIVKEANEKEPVLAGHAYFAPPNYHLLIEDDRTFALSVDEKVNYARPSIDVLFESAVDVYGARLIGVVLTGANHDGAEGLRQIKARGGLAIVQDPKTAEAAYMPKAALEATTVDYVLSLSEIGRVLLTHGEG